MTRSGPPLRSLRDLRQLTRARVGLGRAGASLPTKALLEFTLDHARARDAVHASFEVSALAGGLAALGLETLVGVQSGRGSQGLPETPRSGAKARSPQSRHILAGRRTPACDVAIVIGDGLSPSAVNTHAVELVRSLLPRLASAGIAVGPAVVATGARVALGDEIGACRIGARMIVMLIGERPGLSAPDSLGAYLTFAPRPGFTDADRNCVSNIQALGLGYDEAAFKIAWLVRTGLARRISGVALKDESGLPSRPCT